MNCDIWYHQASSYLAEERMMVTYMVQREIEGIGLSGTAGRELAWARSNEAVARLSTRIEWHHSWISADYLFSLYRAKCAGDVLDHARLAHLPAGNIARIVSEVPNEHEDWLGLVDAERKCRHHTTTLQ